MLQSLTAGPGMRLVKFESINVAFACMPKFLSMPGRKENGICSATSMPLRLPPVPLTKPVIVQSGTSCSAGLIEAGSDGLSTEAGRPVEVNDPVRLCRTEKLSISFLNSATETTDSGRKYHSSDTS